MLLKILDVEQKLGVDESIMISEMMARSAVVVNEHGLIFISSFLAVLPNGTIIREG